MKTMGLLLGLGALCASTSAFAQVDLTHPTVRVDNAFAVPVTQPQTNFYGPGGLALAKAAFNLTPWLDVDPGVGTVQLSQQTDNGPGLGTGGSWMFGLGARVKRPHHAPESSILGASSPWIDADLQYYNTGGLNRIGFDVGIGLSGPLDADGHWLLGPVFRYNQITDGTSVGGNPQRDTRDARVASFGLELEFDPVGVKKPVPVSQPEPEPLPVPVVKAPTPEAPPPSAPDVVEVVVTTSDTVQFDFDSAVLHDDSKDTLDMIAEAIKSHLTIVANDPTQQQFKHVQVDGHASSENHPWATEHNQKLSENRAQAVVDYLVSKGVPSDVLTAKGFGTSVPVASNDTEAGRVANRRAQFEITVSFVRGAK